MSFHQTLQAQPILPKILMIGDGGVSENVRAAMPGKALAARGWTVLAGRFEAIRKEDVHHDVAVLSRIVSPTFVSWLRDQSIRVIMDIDDNFYAIPRTHPGWRTVGAGSPTYLSQLTECLLMADLVTVTTPELVTELGKYNPKIHVIPNGWDATNPHWKIKYFHPDNINIGWAGTITHREDFQLILPSLLRLAKKYPWVKLLIGGDPKIYEMLRNVPERQKQFLPMVPFYFYPHVLSYLDLWLAPLVDNAFNRSKSDIKLVDAGASRTAFVASKIANYERWGDGGMLIDPSCEWFEDLDWLVRDPMARQQLAQAGWEKAQTREITQLTPMWEKAIMEALA